MTKPRPVEAMRPPKGSAMRSNKMERRAATSGALGSALEYFDFAIYGALSATLFPQLFFSELGESGALLASFATFGVGFVARPVGAVVFGYLGDRFGRKPILYVTLMIMGLSSVVIGLLPTGQGIVVATILVGLRFLQGFSLGGETAGNQLMAVEHAAPESRGLRGSLVTMGSPISQVVANLVLALLTTVLTPDQWASWGWRVPFLASIMIVAIAAFIRVRLAETPAFVAHREEKETTQAKEKTERGFGLKVLRTHPTEILRLTLIWGGPCLSFYLVAVYGLVILDREANLASDVKFWILLVANALSVVTCLFGGIISDRLGRKTAVLIGLCGTIVGAMSFFLLVSSGIVFLLGAAVSVTLCSIQVISGAQPAFFAERFPTQSRFSGSALSYTFANLIFSAPAPLIATALMASLGMRSVMWLVLAALLASVIATLTVRDTTGVDLTTVGDEMVSGTVAR